MRTTAFVTTEVPESLRGIYVIDCDTHFVEPGDLWTSRVPAKYKDRVPYLRNVDGAHQWFLEGTPLGEISVMVVGTNRVKRQGVLAINNFDEIDAASYDAKARVRIMDDMNIHAQIVYPNAAGFGGNSFGVRMEEDVRNACIRAYNDAIAEWAAEVPGRLYPQALVPFWNLEAAVEEVHRIASLGLSGIAASNSPHRFPNTPDYGDLRWEPFWEAVSEHQLPISFHVGSGIFADAIPEWVWPSHVEARGLPGGMKTTEGGRSDGMLSTVIANPQGAMENIRTLGNLMYTGVLDRWPTLKFYAVESGIGWVPFFLEYSEHSFDEMRDDDNFGLPRRPTEYFRDHYYVSWWFESFGPRHAEEIGVNNILFESDFPHPVSLYPSPLENAAKALANQPYENRKRMLQDNAAELWKIPLPDDADRS
jgi:predicted TIM-barrel fold metal-dependent hydrolase